VRKVIILLLEKRQKFFLYCKYYESKLLLISNLSLGEKLVRASAPKILNSFGKFGGNPWDALRASRILASKKPISSIMVRDEGFSATAAGGFQSRRLDNENPFEPPTDTSSRVLSLVPLLYQVRTYFQNKVR
jgi:hypothetical protein